MHRLPVVGSVTPTSTPAPPSRVIPEAWRISRCLEAAVAAMESPRRGPSCLRRATLRGRSTESASRYEIPETLRFYAGNDADRFQFEVREQYREQRRCLRLTSL